MGGTIGKASGTVGPDGIRGHAELNIPSPKSQKGTFHGRKTTKVPGKQVNTPLLKVVQHAKAQGQSRPSIEDHSIRKTPPTISIKPKVPPQSQPVDKPVIHDSTTPSDVPLEEEIEARGRDLLSGFLEQGKKTDKPVTRGSKRHRKRPARRTDGPDLSRLPRDVGDSFKRHGQGLRDGLLDVARNGSQRLGDGLRDVTGAIGDRLRQRPVSDDELSSSSYESDEYDDFDDYSGTDSVSSTGSEGISETDDFSDDYSDQSGGPRLQKPSRSFSDEEQVRALEEASETSEQSVTDADLESVDGDDFSERLEEPKGALSKLWGFLKKHKAAVCLGIGIAVGIAAVVGIGAATGGIGLGLGLVAAGSFMLGLGLGMIMAAESNSSQPAPAPAPNPGDPDSDKKKTEPESTPSVSQSQANSEVNGSDDQNSPGKSSRSSDIQQDDADEERRRLQRENEELRAKLLTSEQGDELTSDEDDDTVSQTSTTSVSTTTTSAPPSVTSTEVQLKPGATTTSTAPTPPAQVTTAHLDIAGFIPKYSAEEKARILAEAKVSSPKLEFWVNAVRADIDLVSSYKLTDSDEAEIRRAVLTELSDDPTQFKNYQSEKFSKALKIYKFSSKKVGESLARIFDQEQLQKNARKK